MNNQRHSIVRIDGRNSAFTLVELLIVVGIITVLIAALMPGMAAARRQALNTQCLNNLRNLGLAMNSYAATNMGRLPGTSPTAAACWWPWDVQTDITNLIMIEGPTEQMFFCPFQLNQVDPDWNITTLYRETNYYLFMNRPCVALNAPNFPLPPQTKFLKSRFTDDDGNPDDLELASDAVISANNTPDPANHNFAGSLNPTNHLTDDNTPLGGNVLMLDGHVEWRPLAAMSVRANYAGSPYFWW